MKAQETVYPSWDAITNPTVELIDKYAEDVRTIYIVGGTAAVSQDIRDALVAIAQAFSW